MLVLFDIDGTLVSVKGAGRRALERAIETVTGVAGALEGVRLHGSTDPVILAEAYAEHLQRPPPDEAETEAILSLYLEGLEAALAAPDADYTLLPGADEISAAGHASAAHVIGLATGNVESSARAKLRPGGLDERFGFGGFGSDAGDRALLVAAGITRGQAIATEQLGGAVPAEDIVVIGDTERDVTAAHAAGARAVGVLAGSSFPDALADAGPDLLVDSLLDPRLWAFLRL